MKLIVVAYVLGWFGTWMGAWMAERETSDPLPSWQLAAQAVLWPALLVALVVYNLSRER